MFDPRKGSEANGRPISGSSEMGESQSADGCAYKFAQILPLFPGGYFKGTYPLIHGHSEDVSKE